MACFWSDHASAAAAGGSAVQHAADAGECLLHHGGASQYRLAAALRLHQQRHPMARVLPQGQAHRPSQIPRECPVSGVLADVCKKKSKYTNYKSKKSDTT